MRGFPVKEEIGWNYQSEKNEPNHGSIARYLQQQELGIRPTIRSTTVDRVSIDNNSKGPIKKVMDWLGSPVRTLTNSASTYLSDAANEIS